jgi:bacteriorhodopsin
MKIGRIKWLNYKENASIIFFVKIHFLCVIFFLKKCLNFGSQEPAFYFIGKIFFIVGLIGLNSLNNYFCGACLGWLNCSEI